jgi:hypothetical protein
VLYKNEIGTSSTDSGLHAVPSIEPSVAYLRFVEAVEIKLPRFHVFEGSSRIVIEAQSEDDARYLSIEMGWEFICACEG